MRQHVLLKGIGAVAQFLLRFQFLSLDLLPELLDLKCLLEVLTGQPCVFAKGAGGDVSICLQLSAPFLLLLKKVPQTVLLCLWIFYPLGIVGKLHITVPTDTEGAVGLGL